MKFIINLFVMFWISSSCYSMNEGYRMGALENIFERAISYALVELVNEHDEAVQIKATWEKFYGCELNVDTIELFSTCYAFQFLREHGFILDAQKFEERTEEIAELIQTN